MACYCNGTCKAAFPVFTLLQQSKPLEAYRLAKNLLIESPRCPRLHGAIGQSMLNLNRAVYAQRHFETVREIEGNTPMTYSNIGYSLLAQSDLAGAESCFQTALEKQPAFTRALGGLSRIEDIKGNTENALSIIEPLFHSAPDDFNIRYTIADYLTKLERFESAIKVLSEGNITGNDILARGRIREKQGDYDTAWQDFILGNAKCRENGLTYNADVFLSNFINMTMFSTTTRLKQLHQIGIASSTNSQGKERSPFFITGFPRSGTTLIEQSLSMHSNIGAGDELPFIHDIVEHSNSFIGTRIDYPFSLGEFASFDKYPNLAIMRFYYSDKLNDYIETNKPFITDKMPMNEIHFPLIRAMFPTSPVLWIYRHPLDVVVSNFSNFLTHGGNQAFDLISCANHFMLIHNLVQHYLAKTKPPIVGILPIRYEDFVYDTEPTLKRIFAYSGLKYEPNCLSPHSNPRYARTPSFSDTRKPISDKSISRYKNFMKYLDPVIEIVQTAVDNGGYGV